MDEAYNQIQFLVVAGVISTLVLQLITMLTTYKLVVWRITSIEKDNIEHWKITTRTQLKLAKFEGQHKAGE